MAWQIDAAHSSVGFAVRHMMISTARGVFERFSGTVEADEATPTDAKVYVQIETASINTRDEKRDAHLRSPDFFDSDNYPYMTFKSTGVEQIDSTRGKLTGDLTIKDITHQVVLDFEYAGQSRSPWGTTSAGFSAETKINRKDWNLNWNVALETGGWLVAEEVKIQIELELVKVVEQPEATAAA